MNIFWVCWYAQLNVLKTQKCSKKIVPEFFSVIITLSNWMHKFTKIAFFKWKYFVEHYFKDSVFIDKFSNQSCQTIILYIEITNPLQRKRWSAKIPIKKNQLTEQNLQLRFDNNYMKQHSYNKITTIKDDRLHRTIAANVSPIYFYLFIMFFHRFFYHRQTQNRVLLYYY